MGRTIRRVPKDWEHPTDENGRYIPLLEGPYSQRLEGWLEGKEQWDRGFRKGYSTGEYIPKEDKHKNMSYREWNGKCPDKADYMPEWEEEEKTHIQMYEDTSEGTPISPVMETPEELAHWLADNGISFFGSESTTYEHWLNICHGGCGLPVSVIPDSQFS